jgi:APA family basic amino acid/polyamine antiporter
VVVAVVCVAVAAGAVRQLGSARLAVSPAPLKAALAAADASAIEPLLLAGVVVSCGFALLGVMRGLPASGVPRTRLVLAAGVAVVAGVLSVPPTTALAAAAALLLGDALFRVIAVRHPRVGS